MTQVQSAGSCRESAVLDWRVARAAEVQSVDPKTLTREQRMDLDRRAQVLDRVDEVVTSRLIRDVPVTTGPRVVLAHRQEWFVTKLRVALEGRGVVVLDTVSDGADAVGTAIVEQPDLVLIEPVLARMSGIEVLRDLQTFVPATRCVAQVAHEGGVRALLDAGAVAVWPRKVTPAQMAAEIAEMLSA